uniref:Uncharacterized protein n=1 Tax=viral metagenome TaxID=1070528 RepID=A0A6C0BQ35_9ZZZZ
MNQEEYDDFMEEQCAQLRTEGCELTAGLKPEAMAQCSGYYQSMSPCMLWWGDLYDRDPIRAEQVVENLCAAHGDLDECACYERGQDEDYLAVAEGLEAQGVESNPGCWYRPCKNATHAWIPPDIDTTSCPDICQAVVQVVGDVEGDVNLDNIVQNVSCDFSDLVDTTYSCQNGLCQESSCLLGLDVNCYASDDCEKECNATNFRCIEGICQQGTCGVGEDNCFPTDTCGGACSSNYRCSGGQCSLSTCNINEETCYGTLGQCQEACGNPAGTPKIYIVVLAILGAALLLGVIVFIILRYIVKP